MKSLSPPAHSLSIVLLPTCLSDSASSSQPPLPQFLLHPPSRLRRRRPLPGYHSTLARIFPDLHQPSSALGSSVQAGSLGNSKNRGEYLNPLFSLLLVTVTKGYPTETFKGGRKVVRFSFQVQRLIVHYHQDGLHSSTHDVGQ